MDAHSGGLCICDKSHNDKVIPHEQTYYRDLEEREIVVTDTDVKKQQNDVNDEELSGGDGETNSDWSSLQRSSTDLAGFAAEFDNDSVQVAVVEVVFVVVGGGGLALVFEDA